MNNLMKLSEVPEFKEPDVGVAVALEVPPDIEIVGIELPTPPKKRRYMPVTAEVHIKAVKDDNVDGILEVSRRTQKVINALITYCLEKHIEVKVLVDYNDGSF